MVIRPDARPAERLLDAATELFTRDGIRAVGIERILDLAGVARASLYENYGSKDALVVAYLRRQDDRDREAYAGSVAGLEDPVERMLVVFDLAARGARRRGFRGCLYANAATEFPDRDHPCHEVIAQHRRWLAGVWRDCAAEAGLRSPADLAAELTLLYDGGLAGSKIARSTRPLTLARSLAAQRIEAAARPASVS